MGYLTDLTQEGKHDSISPDGPSATDHRALVMAKVQSRKGTTKLYSLLDVDPELDSLVVELLGVERPSFDEFLRSVRVFMMERRDSINVPVIETETAEIDATVLLEALVTLVVE